MTRWTDAIRLINKIEDEDIKKAMVHLFSLIRYTYSSIPETENGG